MGKKVKTGKSRRDKFYHLAKESGYRSRAAFKLLQLNRKFGFLQQSRVVIDLCAAPGGWLQVVRECAPVSGLVIGVDLVPIRAVPNVKTLIADITTSECRALLRKELQHLKADCVLHDGAPNVGTDWGYDEFAQASLCHQALLLATDFLRRGGTFVTKVFRSADYEKLKFVLLQLFKGVRAAKPEASRLESAEIYLICQGYRAPDQLDPAFRDVTKVFSDVAAPAKPAVLSRTFGPIKKQKPQGYTESDGRLVDLPVSRFLNSDEPLQLLASCGRVVFDLPEVEQMATPELVECCKDIKVLGKSEVAALLQWRRRLLERLRQSEEQLAAAKPATAATATVDALPAPDDVTIADAAEDAEMQKVDQLVSKVAREEQLSAKKKSKKTREAKKRLAKRIQLSMVHQGDTIEQSDDIDLFNLARVRRLLDIEAQAPDVSDGEDDATPAEGKTKANSRVRYHSRDAGANIEESVALVEPKTKRPRLSAATGRVGDDADDPDSDEDDDDEELSDESESDRNSVEDADDDCLAHPLITNLEDPVARRRRRAESWFAQPAFAELAAPSGSKTIGNSGEDQHLFDKRWSDDEDELAGVPGRDDNDAQDSESDIDKQSETEETEQPKGKKQKRREQRQQQLTTPEELAIATRIATSRRQRREVVENGFHRFMFNDDNLPAWFVADEKRHMRPCGIRVSKAELDPQAKRLRGVNVRTVKKVVEAKARKKMKAARRLEKVRKRAETVLEQEGVVDAEKTMQVRQLYKRSGVLARKKRPVVYAVSKRSGSVSRKQSAAKGAIVRRVDPRLKKDRRSAAKGKQSKGGKSKQSRGGKGKRQKR